MAIITCKYDTKAKTMAVQMDEQEIANVRECSFGNYMDDEDYACRIVTSSHDKENDVRTYTHMVAAESPRGKKLADAGASAAPVPGFVIDPEQGLAKEMSDYFKNSQKKGR